MAGYPVVLCLAGRPCVVVGGGQVAARKVEGLLAARARVTVISPTLVPPLAARARAGRIRWRPRGYTPADLRGAFLALICTGHPALDARVAAEGRAARVWVNVADDPARCDFFLPAVVRRGPLTVAVGTGGASPALARRLREELEGWLDPSWGDLAELAAEVRARLRAEGRRVTPEAWQHALGGDTRALLAAGRRAEAREALQASLGLVR